MSESANRGHLRSAARGDLTVHALEQRDTAKDVLLFLDQPCETHSVTPIIPLSIRDPPFTDTDAFLRTFENVLFCRAYKTLA